MRLTVAAVRVVLAADLGDTEVWQLTGPDGQRADFELAKPADRAVLYATRLPGGRYTLGWRPALREPATAYL